MTTHHLIRPWPRLALALALCVVGGSFAFTTDAEARFGKRAGWNKRAPAAINSADKAPRKKLFAARDTKTRLQVSARPRPAAPRSVAVSIPAAPSPSPVAAGPATKRAGLLAKLFSSGGRPKPAARPADPAKPQLAPGQPNAIQAAPIIDHGLIANSSKSQSSVTINIALQRAYVYIGGKVAVDTPISTARSGKYTPRGSFRVGERVHSGKISTIYDVEMPRWMRLGGSAFGMHAGYLPGYPASAGCIRMPFTAADAVYKATGYGTRVKIISG